ncbi:hypothetical protein SSE37_02675 [Sagittula stellata E-37]|uniref:Uncharacterized protein n=1 Tax=Sagittula stellata (strain ATCC 700073 / DSM 11524 / E-37) TaxID=388399 RepID=A3K7Y4_SAGS3|nr:hypothetical protein SSE37_02675 [Sagittula stellata E-37]
MSKPSSAARGAGIGSPVSRKRIAGDFPIARGSRCVPPAPGRRPSLTSGNPKVADWPATMMSACITSSNPPPRARPFTAAISGLGNAEMACQYRSGEASSMSIGPIRLSCFRSAPAAKTSGPPVNTTQRMVSFRAKSARASMSCCRSSNDRALRTSGRLRVSNPTPGAISSLSTSVIAGGLLSFP